MDENKLRCDDCQWMINIPYCMRIHEDVADIFDAAETSYTCAKFEASQEDKDGDNR